MAESQASLIDQNHYAGRLKSGLKYWQWILRTEHINYLLATSLKYRMMGLKNDIILNDLQFKI